MIQIDSFYDECKSGIIQRGEEMFFFNSLDSKAFQEWLDAEK